MSSKRYIFLLLWGKGREKKNPRGHCFAHKVKSVGKRKGKKKALTVKLFRPILLILSLAVEEAYDPCQEGGKKEPRNTRM